MMYRFLVIVCLLLLPLLSCAQFLEPVTISPYSSDVYSAEPGDFDADGDLDVLASSSADGKVIWYENNGVGQFHEHHVLIDSVSAYRLITVADYNNDGASDFVIERHGIGNNVAELMTNNGTGSFTATALEVPVDFLEIQMIKSLDMDQDGLIDIFSADYQTGKACWYKNTGTEILTTPIIINIPADFDINGLDDLDGDGFTDIFILNTSSHILCCLKNDGTGSFNAPDTLFSNADDKVYGVGDLDADGDRDILTRKYMAGVGDDIIWLKNNGSGIFNYYNLSPLGNYLYSYSTVVKIFDFDGIPGDEIVSPPLTFRLTGVTTFTTDTISDIALSGSTICFADFNGDGIDDLLFDRALMILMGNGTQSNWSEVSHMNTPAWCRDLDLADIDKDGDLDLITMSNGNTNNVEYMPYENGSFQNSVLVDYTNGGSSNLFIKDYDADGALDIAYAGWGNSKLTWARNNGSASFDAPQTLVNESAVCWSSGLEDFDGDGDLDVILAGDGQTVLHRNQGVGFTPEAISGVQYGSIPGRMETVDLENDGDMDAIFCAEGENNPGGLVVLVNDGTAHFNVVFLNDSTFYAFTDVSAYDFDQDGDNDLLFNYFYNNDPCWVVIYEYDNGTFIRHVIDNPHPINDYIPYISYVMDVNNDGLKDILCYTNWSGPMQDNGGVYWYKNNGNMQFSSPYYSACSTLIVQPYDIEALDRDHDGDEDFILSDQGNPGACIYYFENLFWGSYRMQGHVFYDADNSGTLNAADAPFPYIDIQVDPTESAFFTNDEGEYNVLTDMGTYTITPGFDTALWTISTGTSSYTFTLNDVTPSATDLDFGVVPNGVQPNAALQIIEPSSPCNVEGSMWVSLQNTGNVILSGSIEITLDDSLEFQYSEPAPDSIIGQTLYYTLDSLYFYNLNEWHITVEMPSEQWMGQLISTQVLYTDVSGYTVTDSASGELTCAYDPNDKTESTGVGEEGFIAAGQWLEYTIRFQNTGNDTATNVTIRDPLSPYLDRSTLTPISWSFSPEISVEPDGDAVFKFKDIMLPDSGANFPGSQGFIRYRIKADTNLYPGTIINNTAHIIFDLNPPITTNTTVNTVECYEPSGQVITWNYPQLNSPFIHPVSQQWYLNDEPIDGATGTSIIPAANGVYRVDAIYPVDCKVNSIPYTFNSIDIYETEILKGVIYPNPFRSTTTVEFNHPLNGNNTLVITDLTGREVVRKSGVAGNRLTVSVSETGKGFFLLYIEFDGKRSFIGKLIAE